MTTSGTINTTAFKTVAMIEKAVRRCGLSPSILTPEVVSNALETLFLLMLSLSSRGLNLWCVDKQLLSLKSGVKTYVLPTGTQEVLNLLHASPTMIDGYGLQTTDVYSFTPTDATQPAVRYGVAFSNTPVDFQLQTSIDNVTWVSVHSVLAKNLSSAGNVTWFDLSTATSSNYWRIIGTGVVVSAFMLTSANREITVTPFNRDDYAAQPTKDKQSPIATNYFFEKLITPQLTLWPVPNDETRHLVLYRYRQIQDVGSMTNELEIPARWYEAVCWQLAARLAFELEGVDPQRRQEVVGMAGQMTLEVEGSESDNMPVYLQPNIGVYSK